MPRYFFHTADGACIRDPQGDELPGLDQARRMALAVAAELLPMQQSSLLPDGEFTVSVADETGSVLWIVRTTTGPS
jgi:hypothetical protein